MKYILNVFMVLFVLSPQVGLSQNLQNKNSSNKSDKIIHYYLNMTGGEISCEESVSYSIGVVCYSPFEDEENYIVESVQQPLVISISPLEKEEVDFIIAAYPNPVADYFIIKASNYSRESLSYHLLSMFRKLLREGPIEKSGPRDNMNKTLACTSLATLSMNSGFSEVKVGDFINSEIPITTLISLAPP